MSTQFNESSLSDTIRKHMRELTLPLGDRIAFELSFVNGFYHSPSGQRRSGFSCGESRAITLPLAGGSDAAAAGEGCAVPSPALRGRLSRKESDDQESATALPSGRVEL